MLDSRHSGSPSGASQALYHDLSRRSVLKYFGVGTAALGSASLLAACGSDDEAGPSASAGSSSAFKFPIAAFPGDAYLLDHVNAANQDFAKHHLDVGKLVIPQGGPQAFQLMVAGAIEGYLGDTALIMAVFANGTKGNRPMIAGFRTVHNAYGVVGSKKQTAGLDPNASFEERMHSLAGKTIGTSQIGSGGDQQLTLALAAAGMKRSDVTVLAVGPSLQAIPNINAGRVDAYTTVQWTAGRNIAKQTGGAVIAQFGEPSSPESLRNQAADAIAVREETAKKNPEAIKNWLAAQDSAQKFIGANPKEAAEILNRTGLGGKAPEIATAYIDHYLKNEVPAVQPMFKAPRDMVERMIEVAVTLGKVKEGQVTYDDIVPEFARA